MIFKAPEGNSTPSPVGGFGADVIDINFGCLVAVKTRFGWDESSKIIVELAKRQLDLSLKYKGEPRGIYEMRRHLSCYFKGLQDFKETRMRMVTTLDVAELYSILDEIAARYASC